MSTLNLALNTYYGSLKSQGKQTETTKLINGGISINKLLSHTALDPTFSMATNSISISDLTMQVFLDDFQETTPPASVNTYPLVGFT